MAKREQHPQQPLKIAFWSSSYFRGFGGAEKIVNDILRSPKMAPFKSYLITERVHPPQADSPFFRTLPSGIRIYQNTFTNPLLAQRRPLSFLIRLLKYFKASIQLGFFFRREKIDIVHLHMVNIDVLLLIFYKLIFKYHLVITFTGMEIALAKDGAMSRWKMKKALRYADRVTTVSRDIQENLVSQFAYTSARFIYNGIDIKTLNEISPISDNEIEDGSFIFCGRLHPVKRITYLIDIFHDSIRAGCRKKLYIIGDGEDMDKARARIRQYGIANQVILLGAKPHPAAIDIMAQGGCLLLSSASEGNPIVVLEAMALAKPVIAPLVGGLPEMIRHGEDGFLYTQANKQACRDYILTLSANCDLAEKMGQSARKKIAAYKSDFRRRHPLRYLNLLIFTITHTYHHFKSFRSDHFYFSKAVYLAGIFKENNITHIHAPWANISAFLVMIAARLLGITYSVQGRAHELHRRQSAFQLTEKFSNAFFAVTNTQFNRKHLAGILDGSSAQKLHQIYNGIDLPRFQPKSRRSANGSPVRLLSVARLIEEKGLIYLLEACAILRDQGIPFRCEIIGGPEIPFYLNYFLRLKKLQRKLQLENHVSFLGSLPFEDVLSYYQSADIFLLPCVIAANNGRDIIPNSLIEAMAMQLPVIATPTGGIPEMIEEDVSGIIVPSGDSSALTIAILRLIEDPAMAIQLGINARQRIEERFDIQKNINRYSMLFKSALNH